MDEQALLAWKSANEDVYSKFKEDLERQLAQPYHQTVLELGDDSAEPLKSVLANLISNTSDDGIDADKLYTKATESGDASAYCLCCYLVFDNGAERVSWRSNSISPSTMKPYASDYSIRSLTYSAKTLVAFIGQSQFYINFYRCSVWGIFFC